MKKLILFVFIISNLNAKAGDINQNTWERNYSDTTVVPQILSLPLQSYIGKPVDSLLAMLPANYTDRHFIPVRIGYCKGIVQGYGLQELNHCFVEIFIDHFNYLVFPNQSPTNSWNMNLAGKETISFIKVWKNNICIYGCGNPDYY